jgi:hypothetical protein
MAGAEEKVEGKKSKGRSKIHHSPSYISNRNHTLLLTLLWFREESKGFLDFIFFFVGYVVLFCELGLSRLWGCYLCSAAFSWLDGWRVRVFFFFFFGTLKDRRTYHIARLLQQGT